VASISRLILRDRQRAHSDKNFTALMTRDDQAGMISSGS
jgi:isopenicillin N synthase-like dioxygenase